ncbi:MAG: hypothetical protein ACYDHX_11220 [Methanothrix sp.]
MLGLFAGNDRITAPQVAADLSHSHRARPEPSQVQDGRRLAGGGRPV